MSDFKQTVKQWFDDDAREQQAEGLWRQFRGRLREAWGALTDDDLDRSKGQWDQLVGRIAEKTGEAREDVARKIEAIAGKMRNGAK
ncbi:MAG: CsbD family protein [Bacteroidetes bacterium]|nr:MAG: CsbD family protein [Bacteroidota bacterium]GIV57364.1 MAG: hypothetical protein KatS3mg042_0277 [Rhodothermaceae bacterium]